MGDAGAQLSKWRSTSESLVGGKKKHLRGPQPAASLNGTCKTPVARSAVKRWHLDAGLLGREAAKKSHQRLANIKTVTVAGRLEKCYVQTTLYSLNGACKTATSTSTVSKWHPDAGLLDKVAKKEGHHSILWYHVIPHGWRSKHRVKCLQINWQRIQRVRKTVNAGFFEESKSLKDKIIISDKNDNL